MSFDCISLRFYINALWRVRSDDASSVGSCFRAYVDGLTAIDAILSGWELGRTYRPYALVRDDLASFVARNVKIGEDRKPDLNDGFSIRGTSGDKRQRFSFVGTAGRVYNYPMANELFFDTDSTRPVDTTIVTYPLMKGVVLATIAAWMPEFCAAYSSALKPDNAEGLYRKAWMTYVTPAQVDSVDLFGVPFSETTPDGGLLLSATDKTFDAADPAHVAGAQRVHEATRHLNETLPP